MASVQCKDSELGYLLKDFYQAGHLPRQPLGLESQKLLANGTWCSVGEPGRLATLLQRAGSGFSSSQGLLVREAGGGGLAVSVTPRQPGWAVSYVQFTMEKDGS